LKLPQCIDFLSLALSVTFPCHEIAPRPVLVDGRPCVVAFKWQARKGNLSLYKSVVTIDCAQHLGRSRVTFSSQQHESSHCHSSHCAACRLVSNNLALPLTYSHQSAAIVAFTLPTNTATTLHCVWTSCVSNIKYWLQQPDLPSREKSLCTTASVQQPQN